MYIYIKKCLQYIQKTATKQTSIQPEQQPSTPKQVAPEPPATPQTVASMPTSGMGATETITQVQPIVIRERAA